MDSYNLPVIDFFLIGAPKCGTTSMNFYLSQHPDIFVHPDKDLCYYTPELITKTDIRREQFEKFYSKFQAADSSQIVGYSSSLGLFSKHAPERIFNENPNAKILIMLRHPTDMLYSYFQYIRLSGLETQRDFLHALEIEKERKVGKFIPKRTPPERLFYSDWADYTSQIRCWLEYFSFDQMKFILFDDLKEKPKDTVDSVFSFIGVDPKRVTIYYKVENRGRSLRFKWLIDAWKKRPTFLNDVFRFLLPSSLRHRIAKFIYTFSSSGSKIPLEPKTRRQVTLLLLPKINELEKIIGRDLSKWKL